MEINGQAMQGSFYFFLAEMTPEEISQAVGRYFFSFLLLIGVAKCIQISRRETTHTLCVHSLTSVVLLLMLTSLGAKFPDVPLKAILIFMIVLVLTIASLVFGILGLLNYSKHSEQYNQGRSQAIWGLILSGCVMSLFIFGVIAAILARSDARFENKGHVSSAFQSTLEQREEFNFTYQPASGWVSIDAKALNPDATLAFLRKKPEAYFIIIAEKIGVESGLDTEALAKVAEANLRAVSTSADFDKKKAESVNGMPGLRLEAKTLTSGQRLRYSTWITTHNGYAYQLATFSSRSDGNRLPELANKMTQGFNLIDLDLIAHMEGYQVVEKQEAPALGYRVDFFLTPDWTSQSSGSSILPASDFIVSRLIDSQTVNLAVVAIELPDPEAPPKDLLSGMMKHLFSITTAQSTKPLTLSSKLSDLVGFQSSGRQHFNTVEHNYDMRLVKSRTHAWLIAGWWPTSCSEGAKAYEEAYRCVEFFVPDGSSVRRSEEQKTDISHLLNELGLEHFVAGRFLKAAAYFEQAVHMNADPTIAENVINAYLNAGQKESASARLEEFLILFKDNQVLRAAQARLESEIGEPDRAVALYAKLFMDGYSNDDELLFYLNLSVDNETYDQAIEVTRSYLQRNPSLGVQGWLASLFTQKGDHDEAVHMMQALAETHPDDFDTVLLLGETYESAERYEEALSVCKSLLDLGHEGVDVYMLQGRCEFALDSYARARQAFQQVLDLNSKNDEAQQYLQYIAALLGEGSSNQIRTPIDAVPWPPELAKLVADTEGQSLANNEEFDVVEPYRVTGFSYREGDHKRTSYYRKIRILSQAGVDSYGKLTYSFNPLTERLFVNKLNVYGKEGDLVAEGSINDYYVLDDSDTDMASHDRVLHVPIPNLKPGCTIEFVVTKQDLFAPDEFGYEQQILASSNPMGLCAVFLEGDLAILDHAASRVATHSINPSLLAWTVEQPLVFEWESLQRPLEHFLPIVAIGDADQSWETLGRKYLNDIEPKMQIDEETRATALRITSGLDTVEDKISALAAYVQKECNYRAIEFGVRSRIPNVPAVTRKNGYGDCKDHSLWLLQLLRSADIPANLALVKSAGPLALRLPSLDQFDHMIVHVAAGESAGGMFLDCTEKNTIPILPVTGALPGSHALLLDAQQPRLVRTPEYGAQASDVRAERIVTIEHEQDAQVADLDVTETLTLNAFCSSGWRSFLRSYSPRDRRKAVENLVETIMPLRVRKLSVEHLEQPDQPLVVRLSYVVPQALHAVSDDDGSSRFVGKLPSILEYYILQEQFDESRVTPFELAAPMAIDTRTVLRLPAGFQASRTSRLNSTGKTRFMSWSAQLERVDPELVLKCVIHRSTGKYKPEEFGEYYDSVQKALAALRRPITLRYRSPLEQ